MRAFPFSKGQSKRGEGDLPDLKGMKILVAEDNLMVDLDLIAELEDLNAIVLGPVSNLCDGTSLIEKQRPDGAILDANLADGKVTPLALKLLEWRVPIVFYTGNSAPEELANLYGDLVIYPKPATCRQLSARLTTLIATHDKSPPFSARVPHSTAWQAFELLIPGGRHEKPIDRHDHVRTIAARRRIIRHDISALRASNEGRA